MINVIGSGKINFLLQDEIMELDEVVILGSTTNVINKEVGKRSFQFRPLRNFHQLVARQMY